MQQYDPQQYDPQQYDPQRHHRHSIRLRDYDYGTEGAYCVTLCTQQRQMLFGSIGNGLMALNEIGNLVQSEWLAIPARFPTVCLDEFVMMPNHLHGIIFLTASEQKEGSVPVLGDVVGAFKSLSTRTVGQHLGQGVCRIWQRNYYEQIIRSDFMLHALRRYIEANPGHWQDDPENNVPYLK